MIARIVFTKNGGDPATALSPTITIIDLSDGSVVVNNAAMIERGLGAYIYDFTGFDSGVDYHVVGNGNDVSLDGRGYAYGGNDFFNHEFINEIGNDVAVKVNERFGGYAID